MARVVALGKAVGVKLKAHRTNGWSQPKIGGRSSDQGAKVVNQVITSRYHRPLGLDGAFCGRMLRFFAMAGDAACMGGGGALFFELGCQGWLI